MNLTTITHLSDEFASVAENLRKVTVKVRSSSFGSGSGVIWQTTEGSSLIITNAHVATNNRATVELWDGRVFEAVRTNIDPTKDLAALKIDATDLPTATIGHSDALRVGELVLAVGNPFGDSGAVTTGIIHANHQRVVMADIVLFPGNSGGPLADCLGRVIGINTMIVNNLAVAIPSLTVEHFLHGNRQKLGVTLQPVLVNSTNKRNLGLLVLSVNSGSAAEAAGVLVGDVLIGVSGKLFTSPHDLSNYLEDTNNSEPLPLQILRGGRQLVCQVAEVV
ncbi:S1C family serine protease [Brasilonema octagenarum]|uniref:Peptidase S1 n=1 Tax=Brasilonema octagenarum UFV-OR1 TaxID=417115 RepID=A0ABX1M2L4_9CYAN|nr:trypsin-like peptidase domain-containing protein [Brasilonema octagenarum]NMF62717.1 peptidase S1 [Brasilonema octagenarum UFV-OR1]